MGRSRKLGDNKTAPATYTLLQEKRDGSLHVTYEFGEVIYERGKNGGLGTERLLNGNKSEGLIYSEELKTVMSTGFQRHQSSPPERIPRKIVEWLLGRCLTSLVTCQKPDAKKTDSVTYQTPADGIHSNEFCWTLEGRQHKLEYVQVLGGILFLESEPGSGGLAEEIIYSEELKAWLSPRLLHSCQIRLSDMHVNALLPPKVGAWVSHVLHRQQPMVLGEFQRTWAQEPWWTPPLHFHLLVPKKFDIACVQSQLNYSFNNPLHLVEAMTHASFQSEGIATPSYQRLAFLGSALMDLLTLQVLMQSADDFTMSSLQLLPEKVKSPAQPSNRAGMRAALWAASEHCSFSTLGLEASRHNDESWTNARRWCNHVSCARASVQMELHTHLLHSSSNLGRAIEHFASFIRRVELVDDRQKRMELLMSHGAPRPLGDMLLACAAAVFLDSDWRKFGQTFELFIKEHILDYWHGYDPVTRAKQLLDAHKLELRFRPKSARTTEIGELEQLRNAITEEMKAGYPIDVDAVNPVFGHWPPLPEAETSKELVSQQSQGVLDAAFALEDFHMVAPVICGFLLPAPLPVVASSPRSAESQCAIGITVNLHENPLHQIL